MKQLSFKLFCLLTLFIAGISHNAAAYHIAIINEDGITIYYNWINDKTELEVTYKDLKYDRNTGEYSGNIIIPSTVTYNGANYSVTSIGNYAFDYCTGLMSVTIPESVTSIGNLAFEECGLKSITLPDNVTDMGNYPFEDVNTIYVRNGTKTLLRLWKDYNRVCDKETGKHLPQPSMKFSSTSSSLNVYIDRNNYYEYSYNNKVLTDNLTKITGLEPNTDMKITIRISLDDCYLDIRGTFKTKTLTLTTQAPKVISSGNVIVAAESNVDEEEENVGFEWRRTDWTDDFPSNSGIAYLYEGTMEGYIRNLNTDKLWKFRPYYLSDSGTYYYGDWMGLDPTNTSYFEPTVHTYAKIEVEGNTALVKGYALNGTDKIAVQGFKYWKSSNKANGMSMAPAKAPAIPGSAQTVEAEGRVMEATLSGLDYETDYSYVAFVKTTEGETFYGDVRSFTTGVNTSGIDTAATTDTAIEVVGIYDLQGHPKNALRPGINIVRYSDGTAKKVMIRR